MTEIRKTLQTRLDRKITTAVETSITYEKNGNDKSIIKSSHVSLQNIVRYD